MDFSSECEQTCRFVTVWKVCKYGTDKALYLDNFHSVPTNLFILLKKSFLGSVCDSFSQKEFISFPEI